MKQKIVIKVSMDCDKCRTKALTIAAAAEGVTSVGFEGDSKDKLVIQGEDVDAACLTKSLRKKLCHAVLETIEEIKPKKEEEKKKEPECPIVGCRPPCPPGCSQRCCRPPGCGQPGCSQPCCGQSGCGQSGWGPPGCSQSGCSQSVSDPCPSGGCTIG